MFLTIQTATYKDLWVGYTLTDCDGKTFHADVVRFTELTALNDVTISPEKEIVYLTIIHTNVDRLKVADRMIRDLPARGNPELQWQIRETLVKWGKSAHGNSRPVICNETGERWKSALACAAAHNLTYGQLLNHLKGGVGYNTVKKKTYKFVK